LGAAVLLTAGPQAASGADRHHHAKHHGKKAHRAHDDHGKHGGHSQSGPALPSVKGPIPATSSSRPFRGENVNLRKYGYTLEEYFVSGRANVYDWGPDGTAQIPQVKVPNAPYTTRILVRRPIRGQSSGSVWVEMSNPSRLYDAETSWISAYDKIVRDRDIHVSITIKPVAIAALKRFDAARYGSLAMNNPLPPAQQTCGALPGEPGYDENTSKLWENGLSWDIVSQIGALLKSDSRSNPLRDWKVRHLFGTSESQTAGYWNTYAYNFANQAKVGGKPIYDGFVPVSISGAPGRINQCLPATTVGDPRSSLPKKHVPYMAINSQTEPITLGSFAWRRPDSDDPDAGYRLYEIAGATHGWSRLASIDAPWADIQKSNGVRLIYDCKDFSGRDSKWNSLPRHYLHAAMFVNMEKWVRYGKLPPKAERIRVLGGGTPQATFETDAFGNVLGGVRSSYVDVPIATYHGTAAAGSGPTGSFCRLLGHEVPFSSKVLQELYPLPESYSYPGHETYVAKVRDNVKQMINGRWLLPEDAKRVVLQAEQAIVP
jgi:hypothetical protein